MPLKPKKYKFKNFFKSRRFMCYKSNYTSVLGSFSVILKNNFYLVSKHYLKIKHYLKKLNKKAEKTKRYVYFRSFPSFPLSKKPQGLRMGKGSGKLNSWFSKIRCGSPLIETKGVRYGRVLFFITHIIKSNYINLVIKSKSKV